MTTHKSDYSLLAVFAAGYLIFVFRYRSSPVELLWATIIFAVLYLFWGIFHHVRTQTFHPRVVLEYLLVALLGVILISTLLI